MIGEHFTTASNCKHRVDSRMGGFSTNPCRSKTSLAKLIDIFDFRIKLPAVRSLASQFAGNQQRLAKCLSNRRVFKRCTVITEIFAIRCDPLKQFENLMSEENKSCLRIVT